MCKFLLAAMHFLLPLLHSGDAQRATMPCGHGRKCKQQNRSADICAAVQTETIRRDYCCRNSWRPFRGGLPPPAPTVVAVPLPLTLIALPAPLPDAFCDADLPSPAEALAPEAPPETDVLPRVL